jgi:hypothetical protein
MTDTSKKRKTVLKRKEKLIIISALDGSILFFCARAPEGTKKRWRSLQPKIESDHVRKLCRAIWGFKSTPYFQELAKKQVAWGKKYNKECEDFYKKRKKPTNFPLQNGRD